MKKIMALFLAFALVGCSGSGDKANSTDKVSGDIKVYTRDSTSGTREAFETVADFKGKLTSSAVETSSNGDMATKVGNDKYGIGYASLTTDFEANNVAALQYEGVSATEATVLDGTYKLQRPFNFITRATGDYESTEKEQLVAAFLDYLQNSTEGMQVVKSNGGIVDVSKGKPWSELKANHPIVDQDNSAITIRTSGSTSVDKTVKAALESFKPNAGNVNFEMNQKGSGDAFKTVLGGEKDGVNKADIGFASRAFNSDEPTANAMSSGQYCIDAVVTIVQKDNTNIKSISKDQVNAIFTGATLKWEDIK